MKTNVKERPILFSGPMVRALLAGEKTQTRRRIRPRDAALEELVGDWRYDGVWEADNAGDNCHYFRRRDELGRLTRDTVNIGRCPHGVVGDRLWVRETWCRTKQGTHYRADCRGLDDEAAVGGKWKSPIYFPRSESRILLEITDVRIERLQDITEADALAEGTGTLMRGCTRYDGEATDMFRQLWESLHGPASWEENPWVWRLQFRRIEPA